MGRLQCVLVVGSCAALLVLVSGCAGGRSGQVETVARQFYDALAAQDGDRACELLAAPTRTEVEQAAGMPCDRAIVDEPINPAGGTPHVEVYGTMGQVRWTQETTFVTWYQDGWRVLAAGCALPPRSSSEDTNDAGDPERYECSVKN